MKIIMTVIKIITIMIAREKENTCEGSGRPLSLWPFQPETIILYSLCFLNPFDIFIRICRNQAFLLKSNRISSLTIIIIIIMIIVTIIIVIIIIIIIITFLTSSGVRSLLSRPSSSSIRNSSSSAASRAWSYQHEDDDDDVNDYYHDHHYFDWLSPLWALLQVLQLYPPPRDSLQPLVCAPWLIIMIIMIMIIMIIKVMILTMIISTHNDQLTWWGKIIRP